MTKRQLRHSLWSQHTQRRIYIWSASYSVRTKIELQMHGETFFLWCSRGAWIMFPGMLLR